MQSTADPRSLIDEGGHAIDPARETNNTAVTYFTVSADQITIVREALVTLTAAITDDPGTEEVAQQSMDSSENLITDVPVVSPPTGTHAHVADTSATAPDQDHETKPQGKGN